MRDETEALVAVPVTNGSTAIGVIECRRPRRVGRSATSVRARDLACLRDLGAALGVALSRAELIDALSRASATDPLTGLANRRSFDAGLARELAGIRRHGRPVSLCLLDVDHFKRYNDTHGHLAGDQALVLVASVLRSELRGLDLAARYGGEEFVLLLPDTDLDAAAGVAERIRSAVADLPAPGSPLTVSIGVAAATEGCFPDALIATADEALYAAKEGGRNRVETADSPPAASA
jgi:diguanylate cyclase (GGDEF)-like protein